MDKPSFCRTVGDSGPSCSEEVGLCSCYRHGLEGDRGDGTPAATRGV